MHALNNDDLILEHWMNECAYFTTFSCYDWYDPTGERNPQPMA